MALADHAIHTCDIFPVTQKLHRSTASFARVAIAISRTSLDAGSHGETTLKYLTTTLLCVSSFVRFDRFPTYSLTYSASTLIGNLLYISYLFRRGPLP